MSHCLSRISAGEDSTVINWIVVPAEIGGLIDNHRKGHCSYNSGRKIIMLKWIVFSQLSLCLEEHTVEQSWKQIKFLRILVRQTQRMKGEEKNKKKQKQELFWPESEWVNETLPLRKILILKMQKKKKISAWRGETDRERNENSHFYPAFKRANKIVLKMLIHKAARLTCASFAPDKTAWISKAAEHLVMKSFLIYDEKGDFATAAPTWPGCTAQYPPSVCPTGPSQERTYTEKNGQKKCKKQIRIGPILSESNLCRANKVSLTDFSTLSLRGWTLRGRCAVQTCGLLLAFTSPCNYYHVLGY